MARLPLAYLVSYVPLMTALEEFYLALNNSDRLFKTLMEKVDHLIQAREVPGKYNIPKYSDDDLCTDGDQFFVCVGQESWMHCSLRKRIRDTSKLRKQIYQYDNTDSAFLKKKKQCCKV